MTAASANSTPAAWKLGDRVRLHPEIASNFPTVFHDAELTVTKAGPVNVEVEIAGAPYTRALKGRHVHFLAADAKLPEARDITRLPHLDLGEAVTVRGVSWSHGPGPYIVLKDNFDSVKLVKLGGDGNRYFPKVPKQLVYQVDVPTALGMLL